VVRNDVHLWGITNGMLLSGLVTVPVEYSVTSTDAVIGMTFYANGSPLIGASQVGNSMQWDTTAMPNGTYAINAELEFSSDPSVGGTPATIIVSNVISFPNYFSHLFGGQMWIYAETIPNALYVIDMYDENTNYLGSFSDYADGNGVISFIWDLTDGDGHTFDSIKFTGVFTVNTASLLTVTQLGSATTSPSTFTERITCGSPGFKTLSSTQPLHEIAKVNGPTPKGGSSSSSVAVENWTKELCWTPGNSWALAYAPLAGGNQATYTQYMMEGGPNYDEGGVIQSLGPNGFGCPLSQGNGVYNAWVMSSNEDKTNFLSYLSWNNFRHCYFYGHGNASSFANNLTGAQITLNDLRSSLGNTCSNLPGVGPLYSMMHADRLVFIDACSSAKGKLSEGFGIPAFMVNTNYFAWVGLESRAFVGHNGDFGTDWNNWRGRAWALYWFFQQWLSGNTVYGCVQNATQSTNPPYNNGGPWQPLDSGITSMGVYGAYDLRVNTVTGK
jgi:hypothetical protein